MKGWQWAAIGGVGLIAAYYYLSQQGKGQVGGSIADQAYDATAGQIFGAPSRNGSMGTSGLMGDLAAGFWGTLNGLTGGAFNNDILPQKTIVVGTSNPAAYPATSVQPSLAQVISYAPAVNAAVPQVGRVSASTSGAGAVSRALPSTLGSYNASSFTYTSPQGYQMSVAPANVLSNATKFTTTAVVAPTPQQRATNYLMSGGRTGLFP